MKRRIVDRAWRAAMIGLLTGIVAACSGPGATPSEPPGTPVDAWARPPAIRAFERSGQALIFHGLAEPGGRVVLRGADGAAYAAVADAAGRFDLRIAAPSGDLLLQPETQRGQDAAPSPDRLLIVAGGRGPVALVQAGGPTRRLDRAAGLGAVDSDGRVLLASGMAAAGSGPITVRVDGSSPVAAPVREDGRWTAMLGPVPGEGATISVGGAAFSWPGDLARGSEVKVGRAGAGWRVGWPGPAGAWQTTWLPDPPA